MLGLLRLNNVRCVAMVSCLLLVLSRPLIFRPLYKFLVANELLSMGYGRRRYD
jgi:hypothetical protein